MGGEIKHFTNLDAGKINHELVLKVINGLIRSTEKRK